MRTVIERFERQAELTPDHPAVCSKTRVLTYRELLSYVSRVAQFITQHAPAEGDRVAGICFEPGVEFVVGVLATLQAGVTLLPLDPAHPETRMLEEVGDSGAFLLLTHSACANRLPAFSPIVPLHDPRIRAVPDVKGGGRTGADSLAYILYTSGSSGRPKGAMIEHRGLAVFIDDQISRLGLGPGNRILQFASPSFDACIWEIFAALCSGATLCVPQNRGARLTAELTGLLAQWEVDTVFLTPAVLETLDPAKLPKLQNVLTGGERCSGKLVERWHERRLIICYGTTETTIFSTMADRPGQEAWPPIGRSVKNAVLRVVDPATLQPLACGEPGELWIGGAGVARGYLNRPEETKQRFVEHAFDGIKAERFYRTGDCVRQRADGQFEFVRRLDHQVKIRGQRLELGEVEARLASHPSVLRAAVVKTGQGEVERLVAFVVPSDPSAPRGDDPATSLGLAQHLRSALPDYMVPKDYFVLDEFPLLASTKIDREQLAALASAKRGHQPEPVSPSEDAALLSLWRQCLGADSTQADFFAAGGDSLLAVRLLVSVASVFGVDVPMQRFLEAPSLPSLAAQVRLGRRDGRQTTPAPPGAAKEEFEPFPMTPLQQAYWVGVHGGLALGGVPTQACFEYQSEDVDIPRLEAAVCRLLAQYPVLRTVTIAGGTQRVVPAPEKYRIELHDLTDDADALVTLESLKKRLWRRQWTTGEWPRFDLHIVRMSRYDHRALLRYDFSALDLASFAVILGHLTSVYENPQVALPVEPMSFRDYVLQTDSLRSGARWAAAEAYWRARMDELPPAPDLPLARQPGEVEGTFSRRTATLTRAQWSEFKRRAAASGLTASAALLTVYVDVLALWSNSERFLLNLPVSRREPVAAGIEDVLGDFTKVLLLVVEDARGGTFCDRAMRHQRQLWADLEHLAFDGVELARELAHGRPNPAPLAPVVFTGLSSDPAIRHLHRNALGTQIGGLSSTPQVWLDCQVRERDGGLLINWDFVQELFPPGLIEDMFEANLQRLGALAAGEGAWQATFAETTAAVFPSRQAHERRRFNDTERPSPLATLTQLVRSAVDEHGSRIALVTRERTLTYADLGRDADRVANELLERGVGPGHLVAIVADKGWQQVIAVIGVQLAGAGYVPLQPSLPLERRHHLLERSGARVALVDGQAMNQSAWPESVQVLDVETILRSRPRPVSAVHLRGPRPSDVAYVIYTSGSTGEPKGVAVSHDAAANTILDINRRFGVAAGDRVFGISELSFDLSVWDLFGTFAAGGCLVLPMPEAAREPEQWLELCVSQGVTIWNSVPQLLNLLVQMAGGAERLPESLRLALLSGDWIPLDLAKALRQSRPGLNVVGLGGATEAAIWSIAYPIDHIAPEWTSIPYGMPLDNQRCHVLDRTGLPCPDWVPGELWIAGRGLAMGYWGDARRTEEQFVIQPGSAERRFRTGDAARFHPDGHIELLGRLDGQVKVNGFRVELGEIEAVLAKHPEVGATTVVACGERHESKRLTAWVISKGIGDLALREYLAERLPFYMIPALRTCERFPLTANGKVDRKELERWSLELERSRAGVPGLTGAGSAVHPGTVMGTLGQIWRDILEVDAVDSSSNFFALGGDSILAMQMISRARHHDLSLKTRDVYETANLGELSTRAHQIERRSVDGGGGEVTILPGQMWFLEQKLVDAHLWHEGHVLIARRRLDAGLVERALAALHEHHGALRSRFTPTSAGPWKQLIEDESPAKGLVRTGVELRPGETLVEAMGPVAEHLQQGLNLERGPVLQGALVDLAPDGGQALVLVGHHLVVDGYSWRILFEDLQAAYEQLERQSGAVTLPSVTTSYKEWGQILRGALERGEIEEERPYWLELVRAPSWSPERDVDAEPSAQATRSVYTELDPAMTGALLHAIPKDLELGVADFIVAALLRVLKPRAGLTWDVMMHGRPEIDDQGSVARTVGRCTSVYPVQLTWEDAESPLAQLRRVRRQMRRAPNGGFNYGLLRYLDQDHHRRESLRSPARVCFNYAGRFDHVLRKDGPFEQLREVPRSQRLNMQGTRRYLLEWNTGVLNQALTIEWRFSEDVHRRSTVSAWADSCLTEMRGLIAAILPA